jgi:hypothetical protein
MRGIVRFDIENAVTRTSRLTEPSGPDGTRIRKALGESADARALLFATGVVLVEGGTELGALPPWFAGSPTADRYGTPDALNVMVFSVDGDQNFGTFVGFLHGLGIPWAIVCDGAVFRFDTGGNQVFEQVLTAGVGDPVLRNAVDTARAEGSQSFGALRELGERHGVFTLADGSGPSQESFETYVNGVAPGQLREATKLVGRSKVRQGRHLAFTTGCPPDVDALYAKLLYRLRVR